jgi:NTE family protein
MQLTTSDFTDPADKKIQEFRETVDYKLEKVTHLLIQTGDQQLGFVDLVMEGGGVKGIVTAGAIYAMEELGLRFRKVAGTSAGGIVAAFLVAAGDTAMDARSEEFIPILANMDFYSFVDGGRDARGLLDSLNDKNEKSFFGKFFCGTRKAVNLMRNVDDIIKFLGINPGNEFKMFANTELKSLNDGVPFTVGSLTAKKNREDMEIKPMDGEPLDTEFQVIVAEISNRRKTVFPRQLDEYFYDSSVVLIGEIIRATMSIPFFFQPMRLEDFDVRADNLKQKGYVTFVDGGLVSNFPLSIFDTGQPGTKRDFSSPRCPTFGLLIDETGGIKPKPNDIDNVIELGMSMFETTRVYGDKAYIKDNPHARKRVIRLSNRLNDGREINTTDFDLMDTDKVELFQNGVNAMLEYLKKWDFDDYIKRFRKIR